MVNDEGLAGIGDNIGVPYVEGLADRLELEFLALSDSVHDLLNEAKELPSNVESALDVSAIASVVKQLRDVETRVEVQRAARKEPYLRAGEVVQAFFKKRYAEPLSSTRADLTRRLDAYKQRQLAEERARREAEAAEMRRQQQEALRAQAEAEAAARRARSAETQEQRRLEAINARADAEQAEARAEEATLATMAKAAQMVGERFEGDRSGKVSMRKTPVVFIDDLRKLDLEALRPYLKEEHLLMALRSWARATNYAREMPGATVGMRDATVVG